MTIVIGSGLIGSAVLNAIRETAIAGHCSKDYNFPWQNKALHNQILELIQNDMSSQFNSADKLEVVWSAGKAGFGCTNEDAELELSSFETIINWVDQLQSTFNLEISISLISSLGGLFEKAGLVDRNTKPKPIRTYGHLKLEQERKLLAKSNLGNRIYRVSSAFGRISNTHRMGLIPTLINNGIRRKRTTLVGHLDTRRDYVWVHDVAKFVVDNLFTPNNLGTIQSLASYQSFSISEIKEKVERHIDQELLFSKEKVPSNAESILICPSLRPYNFSNTSFDKNIADIVKSILSGKNSQLA